MVDYLEQLRQKITPVTPEVTSLNRDKLIDIYQKKLSKKYNEQDSWRIARMLVWRLTDERVAKRLDLYKKGIALELPAIPKAEAANPPLIYGWLTPSLAEELKKLMEVVEWPPPEEPSPTFSTVLQVCDYAFTLKVLKRKTYEMDVGKSGHKKILIVRLLNAEEEELTDLAQRTIAELKARGLMEEAEIPLEEVMEIARKVVGL